MLKSAQSSLDCKNYKNKFVNETQVNQEAQEKKKKVKPELNVIHTLTFSARMVSPVCD